MVSKLGVFFSTIYSHKGKNENNFNVQSIVCVNFPVWMCVEARIYAQDLSLLLFTLFLRQSFSLNWELTTSTGLAAEQVSGIHLTPLDSSEVMDMHCHACLFI